MPWTRPRHTASGANATGPAWVAARVADLVGGDINAFDSLYRSESNRVFRYALALCQNPAWAADATQEAFVALALRPQGFDATRGTLGAYLAGVARHALSAHWREVSAEDPWPEDDEPDRGAAQAVSPEDLMVRAQDGAAIWAALRTLPAPFREALVLVDLQDRSYAEAAAITGIPLNTLRTRLHRARLKLAALLGSDDRRSP